MSHDPDAGYRCPKCGATSALLMPEPVTQERPRDPEVSRMRASSSECRAIRLQGAGGPLDSNRSLE